MRHKSVGLLSGSERFPGRGHGNPIQYSQSSPKYSLEALMLKPKLQYFGYLMWRTDSLEKTLMLGKIEGWGEGDNRVRDGWMTSLTQWPWVWASSGSWWWTGKPGMLQSIGSQRAGQDWSNWTKLNWFFSIIVYYCILQYTEYIFLSYMVGPYSLYILYILICIC